eukprot:2420614-Rhodomonas_salina.3
MIVLPASPSSQKSTSSSFQSADEEVIFAQYCRSTCLLKSSTIAGALICEAEYLSDPMDVQAYFGVRILCNPPSSFRGGASGVQFEFQPIAALVSCFAPGQKDINHD